ncbi:MAG: hypothetical protein ACI8V0_002691, partial [Pseudohongiellaceae bacterium]
SLSLSLSLSLSKPDVSSLKGAKKSPCELI